jgi:transposase
LEEKGMQFYFLPPYSPKLNRIELLWHKMKYEWLLFKTFTPDEFEQAIDEIGAGFGSKYTLIFCLALNAMYVNVEHSPFSDIKIKVIV